MPQGVGPVCSLKTELPAGTMFPSLPLSPNQNASRTILQWATLNREGLPPEAVYHDEWVQSVLQDDDDESWSGSGAEANHSSGISDHGDSDGSAALGYVIEEWKHDR